MVAMVVFVYLFTFGQIEVWNYHFAYFICLLN